MPSLKRSAKNVKTHEEHWISSAILALHIPEDAAKLHRGPGAAHIRDAIKKVFLDEQNPTWWWEHLHGPTVSWHIDQAWNFIAKLCPPEPCFFVPLEDHGEDLYEVIPETIEAILGECPGFEYAVVGKQFSWILIENHHNCLIAAGEPVMTSLQQTKAEQAEEADAG